MGRRIMSQHLLIFSLLASSLAAQTQIDLYTQIRKASAPVKSGTVMPPICHVGDLYVKTDAPSNLNLYACVATNTWALQAGSGAGSVTLESDGTVVGSRSVQNLIAGNGIIKAVSDTGARLDIAQMVDTAVVQTRVNAQSGTDLYCESASGSASTYTCSLAGSLLQSYTKGMILNWRPDVDAAGGVTTLSVDSLGARRVKQADGVSDPAAADIIGQRLTPIWDDGTVFRLLPGSTAGATRPACVASTRGRIWLTLGSPATKDEVAVCAKDASDQLVWRILY